MKSKMMKNFFSNKYLRYIIVGGLCIGISALVVVVEISLQPTSEEKALMEIAEAYCIAITSEDTIGDAWELTDKNYDETEFLSHIVSTEGVSREKICPAEIHGDVGTVGTIRHYDSGEKEKGYIFYKRIDGQWKIELPGK